MVLINFLSLINRQLETFIIYFCYFIAVSEFLCCFYDAREWRGSNNNFQQVLKTALYQRFQNYIFLYVNQVTLHFFIIKFLMSINGCRLEVQFQHTGCFQVYFSQLSVRLMEFLIKIKIHFEVRDEQWTQSIEKKNKKRTV